jgi:putative PIN family toxin of toxin-antitoxin system
MKVIIDTNILVSAAFRDRKPEEVILWILNQGNWQWVVSSEILAEYKEVLRREKFGLSAAILQRWYSILDQLTELVNVEVNVDFPRDIFDAKFLACCLATNAEYFITGDKDFDQAIKYGNTTILSVALFYRYICSRAEP